jgi:hypothetical protein
MVILLSKEAGTFSFRGDWKTSPRGGGITERASAHHNLRGTRARATLRAARAAVVVSLLALASAYQGGKRVLMPLSMGRIAHSWRAEVKKNFETEVTSSKLQVQSLKALALNFELATLNL